MATATRTAKKINKNNTKKPFNLQRRKNPYLRKLQETIVFFLHYNTFYKAYNLSSEKIMIKNRSSELP